MKIQTLILLLPFSLFTFAHGEEYGTYYNGNTKVKIFYDMGGVVEMSLVLLFAQKKFLNPNMCQIYSGYKRLKKIKKLMLLVLTLPE